MKRANVLFYKNSECDSCDKKNVPCAHIQLGITSFVWIICRECLNEYLYGFYSDNELRKLKLENIKNIQKNGQL